jgi:putative transcription antitermination factor YqgF
LEEYFKKYKEIDTIVLGLPYDLYWLDKTQLNKTLEFQRELNNKFSKKWFKIIWVDERFSSFEAENVLNTLWQTDKHWKKDAISAVIILETYLNNKEKYV